MPSAHGLIFCCKELGEKVRVKVPFFIGVISTHGPTFYRRQNIGPILRFFYRSVIWCTRLDFLLELLCVTMAGEVPLLDYVTLIFYMTEVSAHGPIFCRKQLREKSGLIFHRTKSQRTRPIFSPIFCLWRKIGPCALGIRMRWIKCTGLYRQKRRAASAQATKLAPWMSLYSGHSDRTCGHSDKTCVRPCILSECPLYQPIAPAHVLSVEILTHQWRWPSRMQTN